MSETVLGFSMLGLSSLTLAYLLYALLFPERF